MKQKENPKEPRARMMFRFSGKLVIANRVINKNVTKKREGENQFQY